MQGSEILICGILFLALLILLFADMPIAFALGFVSIAGIYFLLGGTSGLAAAAPVAYSSVANFILSCLPLFILMGTIISVSGVGRDLFDGFAAWLGILPGGLAVATTAACAMFAATSGSSVATAATVGKIAIPQMLSHGYSPSLSTGSVVGGGTLGILIPPSISMILYGLVTKTSIGDLFMAGVIPGIIMAVIFAVYEIIAASKGGAPSLGAGMIGWRERFMAFFKIAPFMVLILAILGSMYLGIATPTEAAAIGVVISLVISLFYRRLTLGAVRQILLEAAKVNAMICMIIIGAMLFGYLLTATGVISTITGIMLALPLSPWQVFIAINLFWLFLGCFLEVISIILITVPIIFPIIAAMGWDPVWFGIINTINMEMGLITPPVGLNLYVVKGIASDVPIGAIMRGSLPFVLLLALGIALVALVPEVALWLPGNIKK